MTTRISTKTVTFQRPFALAEIGRELPAGPYEVETEEETIDGASFLARRRIATHFFIRPMRGPSEMWAIQPDGLEAALVQDGQPPVASR